MDHIFPDLVNGLTIKELCEELSISPATARNWTKQGKLSPEYSEQNIAYFTKEYVDSLRQRLLTGEDLALKSRRNKNYISGNSLYNSYVSKQCANIATLQKLLSLLADHSIEINNSIIELLLADCALHLFLSQKQTKVNKQIQIKDQIQIKESDNLLLRFLLKELSIGEYDCLIKDFIEDTDLAISFCQQYPFLFNLQYVYEAKEDVAGLLYISCKNLGNRKASGAYYTPTDIVKALISKLDFLPLGKILDPACGTGNFLIQLPADVSFESVYGNDFDLLSVRITRINMALKYNAPISLIYEHITNTNYLTDHQADDFQYIIGNPPWGYKFSSNDKKELKPLFQTASAKTIESFDIFIEQALLHLNENGHLAFVLPEAILNVNSHRKIREIILKNCSIKNLDYLGNTFDAVSCPCIILDLQYTHSALSTRGMKVGTSKETFTIKVDRKISSDYFSFSATDAEYKLLEKIKTVSNAKFLKDNAVFALGLVTGNNKEYISDHKTAENEPVLKGADISRYRIGQAQNYITFMPEKFQQTAPSDIYRAKEKLLYRFISNQLIFAYDDSKTLSLNSCNILIPKIPDLSIKYVLAILNSKIAQFIYQKEFKSVKVLRSHLEMIPIPAIDKTRQDEVISLVDKLIFDSKTADFENIYNDLDLKISEIFGLNSTEYDIIKKAL